MITAHTRMGVRWIFPWSDISFFQMLNKIVCLSGRKNFSRVPIVVKFDFIDSKLRERYFLTKNLMNKYQYTTSTGLSSLPVLKPMHTSTL